MLVSTLGIIRNALLWLLCLGIALLSWRFMLGGVQATMEFVAYHAAARPVAFYAHVVLAPVALALVPFQLWQGLRDRHSSTHRLLGRVYGVSVLGSGLGGLWLAATTMAGPVAGSGFGVLALLWLASTVAGIRFALIGNYAAHRQWMLRSIALTLAAVTLRIYLPISFMLELDMSQAYPAIAWLCWVPNLLIAEYLIRRQPRLVLA